MNLVKDIFCENCRGFFPRSELSCSICLDCISKIKSRPSYSIFLDDCRDTISSSIVCRDYKTFVILLENCGLPEFISFDYDLGLNDFNQDGIHRNGADCARYLVDYCIRNNCNLPKYSEHTMNPVGKTEIKAVFDDYFRLIRISKMI